MLMRGEIERFGLVRFFRNSIFAAAWKIVCQEGVVMTSPHKGNNNGAQNENTMRDEYSVFGCRSPNEGARSPRDEPIEREIFED